ncbi:M14 family zinc carboxypeptidase [Salirhabdus salicampi]|uniref:M14 family zinc carboxypeptidase n=1 Tax=Salirhabdus salicampi TaxID=476102 RepID=UPI0020C1F566|nr:M14 family zinc carboxypeptidase [Salirhabdus salicampi]MCP8615913.1 carboxypeptidase [Salirhabdus salicampi]
MKKSILSLTLSGAMVLGSFSVTGLPAQAVGEGPNYNGNESIRTDSLTTYEEMVTFLQKQDEKQSQMELEVIGQTVKDRDLYLVKYISNPDNPTILFLTQQHGNEQLSTEGALEFVKHLGTSKTKNVLDNVNVLILPMMNPDGAMGDVNFSLDDYVADGDRNFTRYNANEFDLNREHDKPTLLMQPEAKALHENVLESYDIDYLIDLHHQGTQSEREGKLVSGSILYPTNELVDPEVVEKSKRLGSVVFDAVESKGWGHLGKYRGGNTPNIGRNGIALRYDVATLLFEMRGMADHYYEPYVLGQKSQGYLIKQAVVTLDAAVRSIADGSIETADTTFWDDLEYQSWRSAGSGE